MEQGQADPSSRRQAFSKAAPRWEDLKENSGFQVLEEDASALFFARSPPHVSMEGKGATGSPGTFWGALVQRTPNSK